MFMWSGYIHACKYMHAHLRRDREAEMGMKSDYTHAHAESEGIHTIAEGGAGVGTKGNRNVDT